jgi:hypothetical protein
VIENKNMRVDLTRMLVKTTSMRLVLKNNNNKTKAKHEAGARRTKAYVYYDEFKVIFGMLVLMVLV